MEFLASEQIAVIDLASGEVTEEEFSDELCQAKIGGAGVNLALYKQYEADDPIILGAGLFTGAMVPGSSLGLMTAKSPLTGTVVHAPLTQYAGMELKYSGFDYVVIKGRAAAPSYLWIHDGIADIEDAGGLWGLDVWEACDKVRADMGDELIQVLGAGPAAEQGSDLACVMLNSWHGGDRFGLGKALAAKNLKLIAIRGLGLLEIAEEEDFVEQCVELIQEVKGGAWAGKKGLGDLGAAVGENGLADWLAPLAHRSRSDFNTPFAANTFLFLEGDPTELAEPDVAEPGVLFAGLDAALGLMKLGLTAAEAGDVALACAKAGLDPAGVARVCAAAGITEAGAVIAALEGISGPVEGLTGPFSPCTPKQSIFADFGSGDEWWTRRQAVAHIFGLDPLFVLMCPELSEEKLIELASLGTGLEFSQDSLEVVIAEISG
jgi:aldehyde ferredoxin oxidoreductase-like protein